MRANALILGLTVLFISIQGKNHCGHKRPKLLLERNCRYYLACLKNELFIVKCPESEVFDERLGKCTIGNVECKSLEMLTSLKNHAAQWKGKDMRTRKKRASDAVGFFNGLKGDQEMMNSEWQDEENAASGSRYLALLAAVPLIEMLIQYSLESHHTIPAPTTTIAATDTTTVTTTSDTNTSITTTSITTTTKTPTTTISPVTQTLSTIFYTGTFGPNVTGTPPVTEWTAGTATPLPYWTYISPAGTGFTATPNPVTPGQQSTQSFTATPWPESSSEPAPDSFQQQDYQDTFYQDHKEPYAGEVQDYLY